MFQSSRRRSAPDGVERPKRFAVIAVLVLLPLVLTSGNAGASGTITLHGQLSFNQPLSDVWGWVDPNTNREYALVGEWLGYGQTIVDVHIVDCTDPTNPTLVSTVPNIAGFDVKTWGNYMYTCDGGVGNSGAIVDISNPASPVVVGSIPSTHNIYIDDNGYMYLSFPGLRSYDLNPDPTNPALVHTYSLSDGHDVHVRGNILFDFHGYSDTYIFDISNPASPVLLSSLSDLTISYNHSGWTSEDGNYLFVCDELATAPTVDISVWDISTITSPVRVGGYGDNNAIVHNVFRVGNFLYSSYYTAGFRVFDITNPAAMTVADEYDTSALSGEFFGGAWGCYPFTPSGYIYISDEQAGLFVFSFTPTPTGIPGETPVDFVLNQNYPNPFNPTTTISYHLPAEGHVTLTVYDATGRNVRELVNERQSAGLRQVTWDGRDNASRPVASGVYFYRLRTGSGTDTKRMILLK